MQRKLEPRETKKLLFLLVLLIVGALILGRQLRFQRDLNLSLFPKPPLFLKKQGLSKAKGEEKPKPDISSFGLEIEKIGAYAPIIPDVDGQDEKKYYRALKNGVAQMKGTAKPDEDGPMFIFGHSSFLPGVESDYKDVFKKLNELEKGDKFTVFYKNNKITYEVFGKKLTHDQDWSILDPTPDDKKDKTLTLMTCWPPGTLLKRYAVFSKQI